MRNLDLVSRPTRRLAPAKKRGGGIHSALCGSPCANERYEPVISLSRAKKAFFLELDIAQSTGND